MLDDWPDAVEFVLDHEGGLSVDPRDPGGVTKYGISSRSYPDLDVAGLARAQAEAIYRRDYWERLRCHTLPRPAALALLDTAVQAGRRRAVRWLQEAYNALAAGQPLAVDGAVGPLTTRAIHALADGCREIVLAQALLHRRLELYARLAEREPYTRYLRGWVCRVNDLTALISRGVRWAPGPEYERNKS